MKSILSTKKLTSEQKKPLLKAGIDFTEHDFITIEPVNFYPSTGSGRQAREIENAIFTSQNAVKIVMSYELGVQSCYCVGEKTKKLLEENGMKVIASADYGKELAEIIVEKYPNEHFTFFCGNRRRDELPSILKENKVPFEEIEVYKTVLNPKKFEKKFDGVLFFSPSGVESYIEGHLSNNDQIPAFAGMTAFCIGKTTASEAKKYFENVMVAEKPTIESVIDLACKILPKA